MIAKSQDIALLEMHGTGTPLGDPIEIGAAFTVLQGTRNIKNLLVIDNELHVSKYVQPLGHWP